MSNFFKNYISTNLFIIIAYIFYSHQVFFQKNFSLKFIDFSIDSLFIYKIIIALYLILLIPIYKNFKGESKARRVIKYFIKKQKNIKYKISSKEKTAILSWMVKLFFVPLIILWASDHTLTFINNFYFSFKDINLINKDFLLYFNKHFFYFFLALILLIDTFVFVLGYLLENKKLNNEIKSVDPTILGWFVVLICYPPFNSSITNIVGWYSKTFPSFSNEYLHISLNICILILMGIYSRASFSLGLKASNLTNRGIIKKGPYKYIRHPAYITKNLSWWIGGLPLLIGNIVSGQSKHFFIVLFSLITWSFVYYLRAITEEHHLSLDPKYKKYKKEVKYKFIPKIY